VTTLSAEKRRVLDDHLAREQFAERVRMMNRNHVDRHDKLQSWIAEKEAYLKAKEHIDTVAEARAQIRYLIANIFSLITFSKLDTYEKEKSILTTRNVAQLKKLGQETLVLED
jgi:GTP-dependent phosphoenolpyruvate carboxykinase